MIRYSLILAVVALAGCANVTTRLVKGDQERFCYLYHHGSFDEIPASQEYNHCLNEAGKDGFQIAK